MSVLPKGGERAEDPAGRCQEDTSRQLAHRNSAVALQKRKASAGRSVSACRAAQCRRSDAPENRREPRSAVLD